MGYQENVTYIADIRIKVTTNHAVGKTQVTFFVYMLQSYDTVVQHAFAILTNAVFIRENSE